MTRTSDMINRHPCTPIQPFYNLSALSTTGWCPENFVTISLTVQESSRWQTDRQTHKRTLLKTIQYIIASWLVNIFLHYIFAADGRYVAVQISKQFCLKARLHFWVGFANPQFWGRGGRRRSGPGMVPFERALVSFYRPSIVTFPLSLRVSEILPLLFSSMPLSLPHL